MRRCHVTSGESSHHRVGTGQLAAAAAAGAAQTAATAAFLLVFVHGDKDFSKEEIVVFSGASLPAPYSILEVGPLGPAGGAAEGSELGCGAPGATYGSTADLNVLL